MSFASTAGASGASGTPRIGIIIDDIGYRYHDDQAAIGLPGPLAYAVMPLSPHAGEMSRLAGELGKIVLLHLPMEAAENYYNHFLGPGALTLGMTRQQFLRTLDTDLDSVPDAVGVNNHMGSLLTRYPGRMEWVMEALKARNKFYVDSMTSRFSVAGTVAQELRVPTLRRDVFLDNCKDENYIRNQFLKLVEIAWRKGSALAIGHPRPDTIKVLRRQLRLLDGYGVRLVSLEKLLRERRRPSRATSTLAGTVINDGARGRVSSIDAEDSVPAAGTPGFAAGHSFTSH